LDGRQHHSITERHGRVSKHTYKFLINGRSGYRDAPKEGTNIASALRHAQDWRRIAAGSASPHFLLLTCASAQSEHEHSGRRRSTAGLASTIIIINAVSWSKGSPRAPRSVGRQGNKQQIGGEWEPSAAEIALRMNLGLQLRSRHCIRERTAQQSIIQYAPPIRSPDALFHHAHLPCGCRAPLEVLSRSSAPFVQHQHGLYQCSAH